jgi:hypothetical protein
MAPGAGAPPAPELRPVEVTRQGDRVVVGWERYHGNLRRPRWLRVDGTSVHLRVSGDTVEVVMIYNVGDSGMSPTAMVAQACRTAGVPQPRILRGTRILAMQRSLAQYPVGTRFTGEQVESMNAGARYMAQALGARVQGGTVIDVPQGAAGAPSRSMELELAYRASGAARPNPARRDLGSGAGEQARSSCTRAAARSGPRPGADAAANRCQDPRALGGVTRTARSPRRGPRAGRAARWRSARAGRPRCRARRGRCGCRRARGCRCRRSASSGRG